MIMHINQNELDIGCQQIHFDHLRDGHPHRALRMVLAIDNNINDSVALLDSIISNGNHITDLYVGTNEFTVLYDLHNLDFTLTQFEDTADGDFRTVVITIAPIDQVVNED